MSVCAKPIVAAKIAVSAPITATTSEMPGASWYKHVRAGHHVDAGGHHRRRVDQGGDRRGAGHGVRQPDVERNLGALAGRAGEDREGHEGGEAQPEQVGALDSGRVELDRPEDPLVVECAEAVYQREDRRQEGEVADPVHDEGLAPGVRRELLVVVEADEEV